MSVSTKEAALPSDHISSKSLSKRVRERVHEFEARLARSWATAAHRRLFRAQWHLPPTPEWFDHSQDLYYQWQETRNSLWLERGAFGSLALKNKDVLELACGDGFNAKNFYSLRSTRVVAVDFDPVALDTARKKNAAPNVEYVLADIRHQMPEGVFDNVVWDAAIEHFTPTEIDTILANIKKRVAPAGILSGYTIVEKSGGKHIPQHEYEFKDMQDLKRFFEPYFKNVTVFETIYPTRHNLYFWASDAAVPFGPGWEHMV